jgi:PAS domain S-box-containing protein
MVLDDKELHCVIVIDVTRQELRRRHEAIVNSSADAIYSLSLDGTIATWNQAAERLYGYGPQEVIGRKVGILFPPQEPGTDLPSARLLGPQRPQRHETVQIVKSGKRIDVAISVAGFSDGDRLEGFSVIAREHTNGRSCRRGLTGILLSDQHHAPKTGTQQCPSTEYWRDRADEVRAIADCMKGEETRRIMAEIAGDYDRLSKDAKRHVTQKERNEQEANYLRQRQATVSLLDAPFAHASAKQAIEALMETPFSPQ